MVRCSQVSKNAYNYLQTLGVGCKCLWVSVSTCKFPQVAANVSIICRCLRVSANVYNYLQISAGVCKHLQTSADAQRYQRMSIIICRYLQLSAGVWNLCGYPQVSAAHVCRLQQVPEGVCAHDIRTWLSFMIEATVILFPLPRRGRTPWGWLLCSSFFISWAVVIKYRETMNHLTASLKVSWMFVIRSEHWSCLLLNHSYQLHWR